MGIALNGLMPTKQLRRMSSKTSKRNWRGSSIPSSPSFTVVLEVQEKLEECPVECPVVLLVVLPLGPVVPGQPLKKLINNLLHCFRLLFISLMHKFIQPLKKK